jgi:hypothetical protein
MDILDPLGPRPFFCLLTLDATEQILDAVRINRHQKLVFGSDQECDVVLPSSPHPRLLSIRIRIKWFTVHPECGNMVQFESHNQSLTSSCNDPSTVAFNDVFSICGQRFKVVDRRPERSVHVRRRVVAKRHNNPYPIPNPIPIPIPIPRDSVQLPPKTVSKNDQER